MKAIRFIAPIILLLQAGLLQAQPGAQIDMRLLRPIQFQMRDARDLMQGQLIEQAVELRVRSRPGSGQVYVSLSPDVRFPKELAGSIMLRLNYTTAPAGMIVRRELPLGTIPELVVNQAFERGPSREYIYVYDVVLRPVTQFVTPGNAGFSINFSTRNL